MGIFNKNLLHWISVTFLLISSMLNMSWFGFTYVFMAILLVALPMRQGVYKFVLIFSGLTLLFQYLFFTLDVNYRINFVMDVPEVIKASVGNHNMLPIYKHYC